ncbi:MAG: methyltransferase domain-containing protein [Acidobacteriota bacterium]
MATADPHFAEPELLDRTDLDPQVRERALAGLSRVNRWLFGSTSILRTLVPLLAEVAGPVVAIDLGTGTGEMVERLRRPLARRGVDLSLVAVDRQIAHLAAGRRAGFGHLPVVADAAALPFREGTCDWAISTLFFHHFDGSANRAILKEMRRVSRRGLAVVDLRRNPLAGLLVRLLLPALGVCRITRHDGIVSVRRSWRLDDLRRLVRDWPDPQIRRRFPFRFSLVIRT